MFRDSNTHVTVNDISDTKTLEACYVRAKSGEFKTIVVNKMPRGYLKNSLCMHIRQDIEKKDHYDLVGNFFDDSDEEWEDPIIELPPPVKKVEVKPVKKEIVRITPYKGPKLGKRQTFDQPQSLTNTALQLVMTFMGPRDLCKFASLNKEMNKVCSADLLWKQVYERCGLTTILPQLKAVETDMTMERADSISLHKGYVYRLFKLT